MIRIYIYKILYNNFGIDSFIRQEMVDKYKLKDYKDFDKFISRKELDNIYKIEYQIITLKDDYYEESYKIIEKYKKNEFKNTIKKTNFDIEEFAIDNFYIISYNLMLSKLQTENSDFKINFFKNICEPLFKEDKLLFKAIELFYNPTKYKEIKRNFKIHSNNIKAILFGYRYCLNTLSLKKTKGIYYPLYDNNYLNILKEQFYHYGLPVGTGELDIVVGVVCNLGDLAAGGIYAEEVHRHVPVRGEIDLLSDPHREYVLRIVLHYPLHLLRLGVICPYVVGHSAAIVFPGTELAHHPVVGQGLAVRRP